MLVALFIMHCSLFVGTAGAQKLTINKQTIDVGKTGFEVPVTATFELRNKSTKPMVIEKLQKSLTNLEKKTEEQKKKKLDTLSGLIRQLTILVGVAGGAWIIVTILNLFKG